MQQLDATFSALSDSTRRAIIARLAEGETTLSDLAAPFDMSLTAVSKHLRILAETGLVSIEKRGRTKHCRLIGAPIKDAVDWLGKYEAFWLDRFEALGHHLAKEASDT